MAQATLRFALRLSCLMATACAFTAAAAEPALVFPHIDRGACPGESCYYGYELIARQDTPARYTYNATAKPAFTIRKNERVYARGKQAQVVLGPWP